MQKIFTVPQGLNSYAMILTAKEGVRGRAAQKCTNLVCALEKMSERRYHMHMKKILVIQDMCCVGQCSLSVSLPVLSACGVEVCALPAQLLSTHSVGFKDYARVSLAETGEEIISHLKKSGITFDGMLTGYLGGIKELRLALHAARTLLHEGAPRIVDPSMGDFGGLYPDLSGEFVAETRSFASGADVILPNYTEACLLAREEYVPRDRHGMENLIKEVAEACDARAAIMTGIELEGKIGLCAYDRKGKIKFKLHEKADRVCHGAGDVFASAFTGVYLKGKSVFEAAEIAENFTLSAIKATDKDHLYGLQFEKCLSSLSSL